ncbi:hypothetical protein VNO80_02354 [Phaseolus coccineus]|uniref:Uncharacterized protein n=1 Tax=Phaseolus coccineus TaxID=3886 RepID=A0AAN9NPB6_PHACN
MFGGYFHHERGLNSLAINGTTQELYCSRVILGVVEDRQNESQKGRAQLGPRAGCPTRFSVTLQKSKLGKNSSLVFRCLVACVSKSKDTGACLSICWLDDG